MSEVTSTDIILKQPAEVITVGMDFTARLPAGTHIDSADVDVEPSTITASVSAVVDGVVLIAVSGGIDNTKYRFNVTVELDDGVTILEGDGILKVRDK